MEIGTILQEQIVVVVGGSDSSVAWMVPAISSGLSRTLAVVCVEPLEFLKTQAQARMPGGFIGAIRRVGGEAKVHGVLYLWKGVYTNLLRDISFSALHWLMSLSDKSVMY